MKEKKTPARGSGRCAAVWPRGRLFGPENLDDLKKIEKECAAKPESYVERTARRLPRIWLQFLRLISRL